MISEAAKPPLPFDQTTLHLIARRFASFAGPIRLHAPALRVPTFRALLSLVRRGFSVMALLSISTLLHAMAQARDPETPKSEILATVNGQAITVSQLEEAIRPQVDPLKRQIERTTDAALSTLIDNLILEQAAKSDAFSVEEYLRLNLKVSAVADEEVERAYEGGKHQFPGFPPWEAKYRIRKGMEEKRRSEALAHLLQNLRKKANITNFLEEGRAAKLNLHPGEGPYLGNPDAGAVVVMFSDFECPYCQQEQPRLKQLLEKWPNEVRLVYKHFPLDHHASAFQAAVASVCASKQGRFWELHDRLFEEGRDISRAGLLAAASSGGLKLDAFQKCVTSAEAREEVRQDIEVAREAGVDGTPAYFVNNRRVRNVLELENAIERALALK
jgi:protein-disulfide isomerase